MYRRCLTCEHWQGRTRNRIADSYGLCTCICSVIEPRLWEMEALIHNKRFNIPFDPHDIKYFAPHPDVIKRLRNTYIPPGIKREIVTEEDIKLIINPQGQIVGERVAKAKIIYFKTKSSYECEHWRRHK